LRDSFALVDASQFCLKVGEKGFRLFHQEQRSLSTGKTFWLGIFAHGTHWPGLFQRWRQLCRETAIEALPYPSQVLWNRLIVMWEVPNSQL